MSIEACEKWGVATLSWTSPSTGWTYGTPFSGPTGATFLRDAFTAGKPPTNTSVSNFIDQHTGRQRPWLLETELTPHSGLTLNPAILSPTYSCAFKPECVPNYFLGPPDGRPFTQNSMFSVVYVPNMGFLASTPDFGQVAVSLDGRTWSPYGNDLSFGRSGAITVGNRAYVVNLVLGSVNVPFFENSNGSRWCYQPTAQYQLAACTAETFPDAYTTDSFFARPVHTTNCMASNGKYLFVVDAGTSLSRVPLLPEFTITSTSLPSDPTDVDVDGINTNQAASLSWTAPDSSGSSSISEYVVRHSTDGGATWTLAPTTTSLSTTRTISGLTNGSTYLFQVAAVNESGRGPFSVPSAPYTPRPTPPSAPMSVTATPVGPQESVFVGGVRGNYNVRFRIDWTQSGDGGSPVTGYIIKRFPYDLEVARVTSASTTFTTSPASTVRVFSPGDSVQFEVIAINASGESAPSSPSAPVILR